VIKGGPNDPCLNWRHLHEKYVKKRGRPCPRIELSADNVDAWELLNMLMDPQLAALAQGWLDGMNYLDAREKRTLLQRAMRVKNDKEVNDAIRKQAREKAERERKHKGGSSGARRPPRRARAARRPRRR
jgi:hypothetical protein